MSSEDILTEPAAPVLDSLDTDNGAEAVRQQADRRTFTWRTIAYSLVKPRRKRANRSDDQGNHHVDHHPRITLVLCVGIIFLAAIEAALNLYFSQIGVHQLNGFVASLIEYGPGVYAGVRMFIAGICLIAIASVSSLKVFGITARYLLHIAFFGYLFSVLLLMRHFFV